MRILSLQENKSVENARERAQARILAGVRKRSQSIGAPPKMKGNHLLRCTSGFSALNNTFVLARSAALAHILARREVAFHLMNHQIGV